MEFFLTIFLFFIFQKNLNVFSEFFLTFFRFFGLFLFFKINFQILFKKKNDVEMFFTRGQLNKIKNEKKTKSDHFG